MSEESGTFDVRKLRQKPSLWAALSMLVSIIVTVGGWAWVGGGYSQRIAAHEENEKRLEADERALQTQVNSQQSAMAASAVQYVEIERRLNSIDDHLDRLEHK